MNVTDPCLGSCGSNAYCRTVAHQPNCYCLEGFVGDPFNGCYQKPEEKIPLVHIPSG